MICAHYIYGPEDLETNLRDWGDRRHCLSIGKQFSVRLIGTLDELEMICTMGKLAVEHERKRMPPGFEEEKARAQGE